MNHRYRWLSAPIKYHRVLRVFNADALLLFEQNHLSMESRRGALREAFIPSEQFSRHNFRCNVIEKNEMHANRVTGFNEKTGYVGEQKADRLFRDWIGGYVVYMLQLEAVLHFPHQLGKLFFRFLPGHILQAATPLPSIRPSLLFSLPRLRYFPLRTPFTNLHLAPDYWHGLFQMECKE